MLTNKMFTLNMLVSSAAQAAVFSAVPFLWWLAGYARVKVYARTGKNVGDSVPFFRWIGLKRPVLQDKLRFAILFVCTVLAFVGLSFLLTTGFVDVTLLAGNQFAGMGLSALPAVLIYAFIQTALAEEVLFRGFLGKRLAARFGFAAGNSAQGILFGLIHGILFFQLIGPLKALIITAITGGIGWLMGYIDERCSDGSILPSILLHGLANVISAFIPVL